MFNKCWKGKNYELHKKGKLVRYSRLGSINACIHSSSRWDRRQLALAQSGSVF